MSLDAFNLSNSTAIATNTFREVTINTASSSPTHDTEVGEQVARDPLRKMITENQSRAETFGPVVFDFLTNVLRVLKQKSSEMAQEIEPRGWFSRVVQTADLLFNGLTPVHRAVMNGDIKDLQQAIDENINSLNYEDRRGFTAPVYAFGTPEFEEVLSRMIRGGFDVNKKLDRLSTYLIHLALKANDINAFKSLLAHGARIDVLDGLYLPFSVFDHVLSSEIPPEALETLLESKLIDAKTVRTDWDQIPLQVVAWRKDLPKLKLLLQYGADANERSQSPWGNTALHHVVREAFRWNSAYEMAKELLAYGASPLAINKEEEIPLINAHNNRELTTLFLQHLHEIPKQAIPHLVRSIERKVMEIEKLSEKEDRAQMLGQIWGRLIQLGLPYSTRETFVNPVNFARHYGLSDLLIIISERKSCHDSDRELVNTEARHSPELLTQYSKTIDSLETLSLSTDDSVTKKDEQQRPRLA